MTTKSEKSIENFEKQKVDGKKVKGGGTERDPGATASDGSDGSVTDGSDSASDSSGVTDTAVGNN